MLRNLLRVADFLPAAYVTGLMSCLLSRRFQRLGDLVADTMAGLVRGAIIVGLFRFPLLLEATNEARRFGGNEELPLAGQRRSEHARVVGADREGVAVLEPRLELRVPLQPVHDRRKVMVVRRGVGM